MKEDQIREKVAAFRILESRLEALARQREIISNKILEIDSTVRSIKEVSKTKDDVLFPLGSEAYTFGKMGEEKNFIVEIGANVALEKTGEEAIVILNKRKSELETIMKSSQEEISKTSALLYHP